MTRLIDADKITYTPSVPTAVLSRIVNAGREEDAKGLLHVSRAEIEAQPTVDAVQVIRCKDCDHSSISATSELRTGEIEPAGYICRLHREPTQGNGFCHKAMPKRKGKENQ